MSSTSFRSFRNFNARDWIRLLILMMSLIGWSPLFVAVAGARAVEAEQGWQHGAYLDVSYGANFNFPENHRWRSKETTERTNILAPNIGLVYLRKEPDHQSRWGMELALQGGYDTEKLVPEEQPMSGADILRHLARANVSYLLPLGHGLELTAGLMKGFVNYESFYAKNNFNYTRAYLTDYNPNFMFAVGGRYTLTPNVDVGMHILNGFQYLTHPNNLPSYAAELDWRVATRMTLYQNVYYGPDQTSTGIKFWRLFSDTTVQWRGEDWTVALTYDIGTERSADERLNPRQFWMGSALFTQYELGGPWAIAVRPEIFWDRDGILTQARQLLVGVTSTISYRRHIDHHELIVRLEYRFDRSTGPAGGFFKGDQITSSSQLVADQHVLWLGFLWAYDA